MKKSKLFVGLVLGASIYLGNLTVANAVNFYDTVGTKYEGAVERLAELNIVAGTSTNVFSPEKKVTRAEFAKMIVEATLTPAQQNALDFDFSKVNNYKDVDKNAWYYRYVTIAINNNYMQGYEDNTFKPNKEVSYAEIAKMVTKALGHTYLKETDPRGWAAEYIDKAYSENLFNYVSFNSASENAIRGDVANIIWNTLKADEWHMILRNDETGFTYVNTNHTLFDSRIVDHVLLKDASIQGYKEINGNIYVEINGNFYKFFDQKSKVYFSSIGGQSDVLLKRVEYPGKEIAYEVVGISTDTGSRLYAGTYKELEADNIDLTHLKRLSPKSDYAYVYHYADDPSQDRSLALNLSETYLVEELKVETETPEKDKGEDKKTSHSKVDNQYQDDMIAYRYKAEDKVLYKTITINKGDLVLEDGVVLFKDNNRVQWSTLKKDDVLIEVTKGKYYFIQSGREEITAKLRAYSNKKNDYYIETSKGKYETYDGTLYNDYLSNDAREFNHLSKTKLDNLIGKNISFITDMTDRVIKITLLEDDITMQDVNVGIFDKYISRSDKSGIVRLIQDGKEKSYPTTTSVSINKGQIVRYKPDTKNGNNITNVTALSAGASLTDKVKFNTISLEKLADRLEYFEDDELTINKITYHYKFGKYQEVESYDVKAISIQDVKDLPNDKNIKAYTITDKSDVIKYVFIVDNREINSTFYGIVDNMYRSVKEKKNYATITVVGSKQKDYVLSNVPDCEIGDFVVFESTKDATITIGEKYSPSVLGYYKDLEIKDEVLENKSPVAYILSDDGKLDVKEWTIKVNDEEYRLNNYEVFLLNVSLDEKGNWEINKATRITKEKPNYAKGDRIALNEIEKTAIVYRGYTD